jgi:DNA-binding FrmR family transcriptional regulator
MQADKEKVTRLLKTARGQIDGIMKMIDDDRYCIDISRQLMSVTAILKTANREVISAHFKGCINGAETKEERDEKVDELMDIINKI